MTVIDFWVLLFLIEQRLLMQEEKDSEEGACF